MQKIKLQSIFFMLLAAIGCTQKSDRVLNTNVIGISYFYGEGQQIILIGTSMGKIDSSYKNAPRRRRTIDTIDYADKIIISQKSINYLSQYISEHCPEYDSVKTKIPVMGVRTYGESGESVCIMNETGNIENFASGFLKWIDSANNQNDLSEIREYIAPFKDLSD